MSFLFLGTVYFFILEGLFTEEVRLFQKDNTIHQQNGSDNLFGVKSFK